VHHVCVSRAVLSPFELLAVELVILLLELPHFLDFVKVDDEACLQVVHVLDALATEN